MIVVNDLCGDEDDTYIWCEYFKLHMHAKYKDLLEVCTVNELFGQPTDLVLTKV